MFFLMNLLCPLKVTVDGGLKEGEHVLFVAVNDLLSCEVLNYS